MRTDKPGCMFSKCRRPPCVATMAVTAASPEPVALYLRIEAEEAVAELPDALRRDARAVVAHRDGDEIRSGPDRHRDLAAGPAVLERVVDQVGQRLRSQVGVTQDAGIGVTTRIEQEPGTGIGQHLVVVEHLAHHAGHDDRAELRTGAPASDSAMCSSFSNTAIQILDLLSVSSQPAAPLRGRGSPSAQSRRPGRIRVSGCAGCARSCRHASPRPSGALDPVEHAVDVAAEHGELVAVARGRDIAPDIARGRPRERAARFQALAQLGAEDEQVPRPGAAARSPMPPRCCWPPATRGSPDLAGSLPT